jgi:tetratricopeptide (TPR) repeat protein
MKKLILFSCLLVAGISYAQGQNSGAWRDDLDYLVQRIEIHCSIDYYQDSEPSNFNIINAPDIWTEMTAADYMNNIDPAMGAVKDYDQIAYLVKTSVLELEQVYTDSGLPKMIEKYSLIKPTLLESGYNLEKFLKEFYDGFLSVKKKSVADLLDYLSFAVSECAESIDLCYSLAVLLDSEGRYDDAKTMYNRCIQINSAHHYAKMELDLMELKEKYH